MLISPLQIHARQSSPGVVFEKRFFCAKMCEKRKSEMRRKIPSTAALVAFDSAARHQSFTLAADELSLTQSAVGRQIANLEELLGVKLFRRTRRGVALTPAGSHYSAAVSARLEEVERDALEVMSRAGGGGALDLGVVPTFATHWLIPRLPAFNARHPHIQIHLHSRTRPFLFADSGLDAAIHAGKGGWPGTVAHRLMSEPMVVVYAPGLAGRRRLAIGDIPSLPLIQMATRPYAWREWLQSHGLSFEGDMAGPRVELFSMASQAAIHGLGAALVPYFFVQEELARGALVTPRTSTFESGLAYYLVYPEQDSLPRELTLLRDWLLEESS